ncbi:MAG: hypothetical protein AAF456_15305 [Planctomycetota bacterium]
MNEYAVQLFKDEKFDEAKTVFGIATDLDDRNENYRAHSGAAKYSLGQYESAIDDLTIALDLVDNHQIALTYRGYSWQAIGNYRAAVEDMSNVQCISAEHYYVAYYRGHLHEKFEQWQRAIDDYLLAFDLDSTQTGAGVSLARIQAGCPDASFRDADKAIENSQSMCARTNWKDWVPISVLAAAHAESGDFKSAIKYAQQALDLAPEIEKPERSLRVAQYQNSEPFRIPAFNSNQENNDSSAQQ